MAWAEEVAEVLDQVGDTAYDEGFGPLTATVPADRWSKALTLARDSLGCTYFDWLSAVDELSEGFAVVCHLAHLGSSATARGESPEELQTNRAVAGVEHLLIRTMVPRESPQLASVVEVYAGASWHERETQEMFGIRFLPPGDRTVAETEANVKGQEEWPSRHLLLPEEFEGHPLRKDFVLVSRVAKPWPGAKEPGESDEGGSPSRRRTRPPGV
ncbi:MAG: NADH-quinone oxidoreductase subunit C, partial [Nocardioidaceae bacterium]